jgi:hypothetical protein
MSRNRASVARYSRSSGPSTAASTWSGSSRLLARDFSQAAPVGHREGGSHGEDLRRGGAAILGDAVEIARQLPPQLLVHLSSQRLVEVALGSLITTGLTTEVFLAAAGAVLSWANDPPLPLGPLLATYGTDVLDVLLQVRSTLKLLSGLEFAPSPVRIVSMRCSSPVRWAARVAGSAVPTSVSPLA